MIILLQNFNRNTSKFEIGKQEVFHISLQGLKKFLYKIPYDKSNTTIPIKIITEDLILEKVGHQKIRYEWNSFYTIRLRKRDKYTSIQELDKLIHKSKKKTLSNMIDRIITAFYTIIWLFLLIFNMTSLLNFIFTEFTNKYINIFFIWLIILTLTGCWSYLIKNVIPNLIFYRKKRYLDLRYTIINDIEPVDITNVLILLSQYFYIMLIFYYFPNAYLNPYGRVLYFILLVIGIILIAQEVIQIVKDWYFNYKKKNNFLWVLYSILNYNKNKNSDEIIVLASELKKINLINQRLWKTLIGILIFLLSLLPIL